MTDPDVTSAKAFQQRMKAAAAVTPQASRLIRKGRIILQQLTSAFTYALHIDPQAVAVSRKKRILFV